MRTFIRHPADIPIEVQPEQEASGGGAGDHLSNVSLGGVCFRSHQCVEENRVIRIRIPVVKPVFEALGRVAWCRREGDHFDVGVEFVETTGDAFRLKMVEQICHIEHYKREVREREGRELSGHEAAMEWISKFAGTFEEAEATKR